MGMFDIIDRIRRGNLWRESNDEDDGNLNGPHGNPVYRVQMGAEPPKRDAPRVTNEMFAKRVFRHQETVDPHTLSLSDDDTSQPSPASPSPARAQREEPPLFRMTLNLPPEADQKS